MTAVSRAAQDPVQADDPGLAESEENGPEEDGAATPPLFDNYLAPDRPHAGAWDEMFSPDGSVRAPYRALHEAIAPTAVADLKVRSEALDRAYVDQGITFSLSGQERPIPLDIVPRVISAAEWTKLQRGIVQRVQALEMFLADIYGDAEIVRDGVLPRRLITSCEHFQRAATGLVPPNGVRIHVAGIDLVRDEQGVFRVLEDNPTVVVLTPGVFNSAYFEHSLLARQMGVELVEGRDLFCRDNLVYMRTTQGDQRVDVIYRRIDDEFLDPLQFNPDSVLGIAGLINAARAGNVVIANAVGNGVGDDKLVYTYVPEMIRYYLDEKPGLPNVDTFRCWLDDERTQVLDRLDELVLKPVEGSGGYGILFGPNCSARQLQKARKAIRDDPRGWIAQPVVQLSTVPTKVDDKLVPRHVDLRPFAVNDGESVFVLPGGLTRVALPEGSLVVNSSHGGGSKDTWVLAAGRGPEAERERWRAGADRRRPGGLAGRRAGPRA